jgi:hypothetical protein
MSYGALPAARLMLDKKIIATTPREVFEEYRQAYANEKETKMFMLYHERQMPNGNKLPSNEPESFRQAYIFGNHCLRTISNNYQ